MGWSIAIGWCRQRPLELWTFTGNRTALRLAYEWHDDTGNLFRSHANENWHYNDAGLTEQRHAWSIAVIAPSRSGQ
jgi:nuclear transport factor 2 (NTF2) superfamily protein